jgi:hypothetical protein
MGNNQITGGDKRCYCNSFVSSLEKLVKVTKDRQCAYKVSMKRVGVTILPWKINKYYIFWSLGSRSG